MDDKNYSVTVLMKDRSLPVLGRTRENYRPAAKRRVRRPLLQTAAAQSHTKPLLGAFHCKNRFNSSEERGHQGHSTPVTARPTQPL